MKIDELIAETQDSLEAKTVCAEPHEKNGTTGLNAEPVGAYVVRDDKVRWGAGGRREPDGRHRGRGRHRRPRRGAAPRQGEGRAAVNSTRWVFLVTVALVVTSCAAGPNVVSHVDPVQVAGFWKGLWHGLIYPVTFFISLFTDNVNIYEVRNNGNWYDFGFVAGIGLLHTVTGASGRKSKSRRRTARLKDTS